MGRRPDVADWRMIGKGKSMSQVLVTYSSRQGASAEVAAAVAETLQVVGHSTIHCAMSDVKQIDSYESLVVGAPIYSACWLPEATTWVKQHQRVLQARKVACFVLAIRLRDSSDELRAAVLDAIETERVIMRPLSIGLFAGRIDYAALDPITRLAAQSKGLPEGDFRDWAAIRTWAESLAGLL